MRKRDVIHHIVVQSRCLSSAKINWVVNQDFVLPNDNFTYRFSVSGIYSKIQKRFLMNINNREKRYTVLKDGSNVLYLEKSQVSKEMVGNDATHIQNFISSEKKFDYLYEAEYMEIEEGHYFWITKSDLDKFPDKLNDFEKGISEEYKLALKEELLEVRYEVKANHQFHITYIRTVHILKKESENGELKHTVESTGTFKSHNKHDNISIPKTFSEHNTVQLQNEQVISYTNPILDEIRLGVIVGSGRNPDTVYVTLLPEEIPSSPKSILENVIFEECSLNAIRCLYETIDAAKSNNPSPLPENATFVYRDGEDAFA